MILCNLVVNICHNAKFVCGCFSTDYSKSKVAGQYYGIARNRTYKSYCLVVDTDRIIVICRYEQMFAHECELPEEERMVFVVIASPTGSHYSIALSALEV